MPWYSKEQLTPLNNAAIPGLEFLHGDVLARQYRQTWLQGKKYPLLSFPSGVKRELATTKDPMQSTVYIFDNVALRYHISRDEAYALATVIAEERGYQISKIGDDKLEIHNPDANRSYELTFEPNEGHLANMVLRPDYAMELLGGEQRAVLPPLYATEKLGMDAVAPLKFFTPASRWTWYPTEFDGNDLFFGLVSGWEVELGYFSLSELEGVGDALGLPMERDLYFEPMTLRELKALHEH